VTVWTIVLEVTETVAVIWDPCKAAATRMSRYKEYYEKTLLSKILMVTFLLGTKDSRVHKQVYELEQ
jgi:hypothetical protein